VVTSSQDVFSTIFRFGVQQEIDRKFYVGLSKQQGTHKIFYHPSEAQKPSRVPKLKNI